MIQKLTISVCLVCLLAACDQGRKANELGLSASDMQIGGPIEVEVLRENTEHAAKAYFSKIEHELGAIFGSNYALALDQSKIADLRSMGYKSSFYYFCWSIFLPFQVTTEKGEKYWLITQLSDRTPGNKHNVDMFHVIRIYVHDEKGARLKQIENNG